MRNRKQAFQLAIKGKFAPAGLVAAMTSEDHG